jgi:hypothetical protein
MKFFFKIIVSPCVFLSPCSMHVSAIPCKYYPPPINGGIALKQYWGGPAVVPSCNKGYDFATKPSWLYQCFVDGTWLLFPNTDKMPWPDCTGNGSFVHVHAIAFDSTDLGYKYSLNVGNDSRPCMDQRLNGG